MKKQIKKFIALYNEKIRLYEESVKQMNANIARLRKSEQTQQVQDEKHDWMDQRTVANERIQLYTQFRCDLETLDFE